MRITGIAYGWIGSTMAFGAVEGRSQTDVRERLSAAPRSENIAVLRSAARSRRTTAGAAAGEAGKAEGGNISAGMAGRLADVASLVDDGRAAAVEVVNAA